MDKRDPSLASNFQLNLAFNVYEQAFIYLGTWWDYPQVNSPFNRLYIVSAGTGEVTVSNQVTILKPYNAYLLPLHTDLKLYCPHSLVKYYIHFRLELYGQDLFARLNRCLVKKLEASQVKAIIRMAGSSSIQDSIRLRSHLLELISTWATIPQDDFFSSRQVVDKYRPVLSYIQQECRAGLTISELASRSALSAASLSRQFKKDSGIPLKRYVEEKLAQKAKEELILTPKRINEIAAELNFSDEFYFSRFFKKMTGVPPRQYRKQNRIR